MTHNLALFPDRESKSPFHDQRAICRRKSQRYRLDVISRRVVTRKVAISRSTRLTPVVALTGHPLGQVEPTRDHRLDHPDRSRCRHFSHEIKYLHRAGSARLVTALFSSESRPLRESIECLLLRWYSLPSLNRRLTAFPMVRVRSHCHGWLLRSLIRRFSGELASLIEKFPSPSVLRSIPRKFVTFLLFHIIRTSK